MIFTSVYELLMEIEKQREGKKVVLATGTFDLFHYDHLQYLQGAKNQGEILVVAVKSDRCAGLKDPGRPIISQDQRVAIVDNIKGVDYTIIVDYDSTVTPSVEAENEKQLEWLIIFEPLLKLLRPNILYYENNPVLQSARDKVLEKYLIAGVMKARGTNTSTTEIIKKMKS
ncbi:MAG: adenylyltransferase/cytidyltransferase family protein [Clostridia bacterium]|nr:adenylyltransferase/cytidyltransferase family protein [Clostridia bacterium]